jgi:peptidoglycan/LPS O-acetylase OafA/YrhL
MRHTAALGERVRSAYMCQMVAERPIENRAQASSVRHRPELDALRFFAFLSVFLFHACRSSKRFNIELYEPLSYGLPVFFLLSSFLITHLLLKELDTTGTVHVKGFYARRVLRIWPLYLSFLAGCYLLGVVSPQYHIETPRLLAFLFLSGNWYVGARGWGSSPIYPLWSISVEEQFYLIWPAVVMLGARFLKPAAFAITALSLCCIAIQCKYGAGGDEIWTNSLSQFLYFALGTLAAIYFAQRPIKKGISRGLFSIALGVGSWWIIEAFSHIKAPGLQPQALPFVAGYGALGISCVAVLYGFLALPESFFPNWLTFLGKISYGLYVFHKLCQFMVPHLGLRSAVLKTVVSFLATVACAALSFQFLEKPFLKMKKRFALNGQVSPRSSRPERDTWGTPVCGA